MQPFETSCSLNLTIHSGFALPKADLFSTIDAYCILHFPLIGGEIKKLKTKVIDNNTNPEWQASFFCTNVDTSKDLLVEVWDEDTLKDEIVCRVKLSINNLMSEKLWNSKKFILECLGKHKPYKGASECGLVISASCQASFMDICKKVESIYVDQKKKVVVYPLIGILMNNLYMKISVSEKRFKFVILDTKPEKNLVLFEASGRNVSSKITEYYANAKTKYNIKYFRKIKMKKASSLNNLKLLVAKLEFVETKPVDSIVREHGWAGNLSFEQAKSSLTNITVDNDKKSIYMNEQYYSYMVDYDSDNFDQKIWLNEQASNMGYHADFIYIKENTYSVTSHEEPSIQKQTGTIFRYSSQVKDTQYGVSFDQFQVKLYKKVEPVVHMLSGSIFPLNY